MTAAEQNDLQPIASHEAPIRWRPLTLSFVVHALILAVCLLILSRFSRTVGGEPDRTGQIVLAISTDESDIEYLEQEEVEANSQSAQEVAAMVSDLTNEPPPALEIEPPPDIELPGAAPRDGDLNANSLANTETASVESRPYELTADDLKMIKADQKLLSARQPAGPATTLSVFGTGGLEGRKFVFLIDRSKSMGAQGLGVLRQARNELVQAISKLEPHHEFQIIVYNNTTASIGNRQMLKATEENKARVPEFLDSIASYAGTNHQNGIYAGLVFDPDVLLVMTDGGSPELHDGQIRAIARSAQRTQIHTLHFGVGPALEYGNFLRSLSETTAGSYRYVDVQAWRHKK